MSDVAVERPGNSGQSKANVAAPAVELVNVTKRFRKTTALDSVSLSIPAGSACGLIGPNGAGKSTLLRMLVGLVRPTQGTVRVKGRDVAEEPMAIRQRVGYVPDVHQMDRWMRVEQLVGFFRAAYSHWNDPLCEEMLDRFEIQRSKRVKALTTGMLGKLSLVLAVAHEPEVLVLDEPMSGLDPIAREEFLEGVINAVCERGQSVILSSHSLDDVQRVTNTLAFLCHGRLLLHQDAETLLANTKRIRATLTNGTRPSMVPADVIWQRVQGRDWMLTVDQFSPDTVERLRELHGVGQVEVIDIGLEDLFKDLVRGEAARRGGKPQ